MTEGSKRKNGSCKDKLHKLTLEREADTPTSMLLGLGVEESAHNYSISSISHPQLGMTWHERRIHLFNAARCLRLGQFKGNLPTST